MAASDWPPRWLVVVLAAGRGTRMGGPKALMTVSGRPWWQWQEDRLRNANRVWVASPEVAAAIRPHAVPSIPGDPGAPMFSSIQAGLDVALDTEAAGAFILPVDVPVPAMQTLRTLAAAAGSGVAIPTHRGQRGHPAALSRAWIERVFLPGRDGPDARLNRLIAPDATEVAVEDPDVLVNLNTPRDVENWLSRRGANSG